MGLFSFKKSSVTPEITFNGQKLEGKAAKKAAALMDETFEIADEAFKGMDKVFVSMRSTLKEVAKVVEEEDDDGDA